jgi:hypothetical protein
MDNRTELILDNVFEKLCTFSQMEGKFIVTATPEEVVKFITKHYIDKDF